MIVIAENIAVLAGIKSDVTGYHEIFQASVKMQRTENVWCCQIPKTIPADTYFHDDIRRMIAMASYRSAQDL